MDGSEELGHGAGDEVSTTPEAISKQETEQPSRSEPKVIGNRVQVRVTRIKHGNSDDSAKEGSHPQSSSGQKSLQIPEEQRKQLETSVKNELQKAGIENTGTGSLDFAYKFMIYIYCTHTNFTNWIYLNIQWENFDVESVVMWRKSCFSKGNELR